MSIKEEKVKNSWAAFGSWLLPRPTFEAKCYFKRKSYRRVKTFSPRDSFLKVNALIFQDLRKKVEFPSKNIFQKAVSHAFCGKKVDNFTSSESFSVSFPSL